MLNANIAVPLAPRNPNLLPDLAHAVHHVERYVQHRPSCPARGDTRATCGCGLFDALDSLAGALACLGVR